MGEGNGVVQGIYVGGFFPLRIGPSAHVPVGLAQLLMGFYAYFLALAAMRRIKKATVTTDYVLLTTAAAQGSPTEYTLESFLAASVSKQWQYFLEGWKGIDSLKFLDSTNSRHRH